MKYRLERLALSLRWEPRIKNAKGISGGEDPAGTDADNLPTKERLSKEKDPQKLFSLGVGAFFIIPWKGITSDEMCPRDVSCRLHIPGSPRERGRDDGGGSIAGRME